MTTGSKTVLIAEDSRFLRKATEMILVKAGYETITAADGQEALDLARSRTPDVIVLDLMMPNVDGVEVIRLLKKDPRTAGIPVVVISGLSQHNEEKLLAVGASAYYEKTRLVPDLLVEIIKKAASQSVAAACSSISAARTSDDADRNTLLASSCNNSEYEHQLFEQLIAVNNELLAAQRELARANEELRKISGTDELTGVSNRRKATEDINRLLSLATRQKQNLCLAFIDVDRFKGVNDRYGHAAGDSVLTHLADSLLQYFRIDDVVGRWGGEEFVVALYNCSVTQAMARMEQFRINFARQLHEVDEKSAIQVTLSVGIAAAPEAGSDLARLCHSADAALYTAKRKGRNRVVVANSGMRFDSDAIVPDPIQSVVSELLN